MGFIKGIINAVADPRLFFHTEGERGAARRGRDDAARAICSGCPVIEHCLAYALDNPELEGVWGGMTTRERDHYRRRNQ